MKRPLLHLESFTVGLKSLEETVQGSVESGISGLSTRLALIEKLVNTSGPLTEGRETRHSNIAGSNGCSDLPTFGGEYEESDDWQYKVRFFLYSECSHLARFLTFLNSVDREIDLEDNVSTLSWPSRQCNVDESAALQRPG